MFSAETSAVFVVRMNKESARSIALDIIQGENKRGARAGLPLGSINQVTLISLVTLDALSHASYTYDAYGVHSQ